MADIAFASVVTVVAAVVVLVVGAVNAPVADVVQNSGQDLSKYSGDRFINNSFTILGTWVPLLGAGGAWTIVAVRQYRRQRVGSVTRPPPR